MITSELEDLRQPLKLSDYIFFILFFLFVVLVILEAWGIIGIIIADVLYKNCIILDDFCSLRQQNNMNASKYDIVRVIGSGQEGKIFLARKQNKLFALKELNESPRVSQEEILSGIKHPAVINLHEVLREQRTILVLQYAAEGDLSSYVRKHYSEQHVSEGLVRSWLLQLCLGLYHLHNELNLIHRDIKMINVLVMENLQLKLSDFGLAKKIGKDEEYSKSTVGTPYYLSPQTLSHSRSSSKSDMWGLGCLLYQVCTGEKPFKGNAFGQIIKNILEKSVGDLPQGYSKWLTNLINSLLEKNSQKRPSVQTILEDEEMQKQFIKLKAQFKQYEKITYPKYNLKTAKHFERESLSSNLKIFSESLKTTKKQKLIKLPSEKSQAENHQKKIERTRFAHLSLQNLLQRKLQKK